MGLDYSYVLLIAPADEPRLRELVNMHGSTVMVSPDNECATLDFPLDEVLLRYLQDDVIGRRRASNSSWQSPNWLTWLSRMLRFRKQDYPEYFPSDTTGQVGCIYLRSFLDAAAGHLYVQFTAATTRMSLLLQQSPNIRHWFLDLATQLQATAVFLDLEAEGYEFIYYQQQPVSARFTEDLDVPQAPGSDGQAMQTICHQYIDLLSDK